MSKNLLIEGVKSNWYLLLLFVGLIAGGVFWAASDSESGGPVAKTASAATLDGDAGAVPTSRWQGTAKERDVASAIEHYEGELRYNRNSSETPANLYRLANLYYSDVRDYEKAALYYEALLQEFPTYPGNTTVYPNLSACYQRLGNPDLERQTYRRMLDFYPADSQERAFARQKLGM